jgi:oligopeptidase B
MPLTPPVADRRPVERTHHGHTFVDDYEWLRDKESPETLAHLEAENAFTTTKTEHLADLRELIFGEIKARTKETDLSVPTRIRDHWYFNRTVEGLQYGMTCRCPVASAEDWTPPSTEGTDPLNGEEVLLDNNLLAEGHDFFSLGAQSLSPAGDLLAFSTDTTGDERFLLQVRDLTTGEMLPDQIPNTGHGATWSTRGDYLFYTTVDESWRPDRVWRHRIGTDTAEDVVVFHEPDDRFWVAVGRTRSDRFIFISCGSKTTSEYRVLDAEDPTGELRVLTPRRQDVDYSVEHAVIGGEDCFLILHNDGAIGFELAIAPLTCASHEEWTPLIPHDSAVRLEDVDAFATHLVVAQRSEGMTQVRVLTLDETGRAGTGIVEDFLLDFPHQVRTVGSAGNPEFHQPTIRLGYTTMATPPSVYDYDVASRELRLLKETPVLGDFDPTAYDQFREWATAGDGTRVPLSIVTPKDAPLDGSMPLVIYGYGSYETSIDPYFTISRLSLLDRGVGFAIAHVRGGGEMGRAWYDDGKMLNKKNTFTDFVACAQHLVDAGWTSADRMVAEGGSAGGLLMGAVANLAPDLFAGIVADVAFVDPLTSILDPDLPLTVIEWEEWGDPLHHPEVYAYMRDYSPYENVEAKRYPPILAETSLNDTRVLYVEPAKWIARLRATATNPEDFLLKIEMAAGHGGVSGRYNAWRDRAFSYAWILDRVGRA